MSMDRISNLPYEIICHIVSFLSAKEAAFATVLSKWWRNLFTIIPKLQFDDSVVNNEGSFEDFVHVVLALPVSSRIKVAEEGYYSLPFEVFTCKTISTMKLGSGFVIDELPADVFIPSLKSLFLDSVRFYGFDGRCSFQTLLSASPVLEELVIDGVEWERWKWCCTVSSTTLQRLTIRHREWESDEEVLAYDFDSIILDTPSLTYLDYSDYVPKKYPIVNLNSLVKAKIDFCAEGDCVWSEEHADDFDPMNLINGFKNVEILDFSMQTMEMFYVFREIIRGFEKLHQLSVNFGGGCWFSLPILIKKSPNLKTLTIKDLLPYGREEDGFICQCVLEFSFLLPCDSSP